MGGAAPPLRLGEQLLRLLEGDGEDLRLALQRPRILAALEVGTVAAVVRQDRLIAVVADRARQGQELERVVERHGLKAHGRQQ